MKTKLKFNFKNVFVLNRKTKSSQKIRILRNDKIFFLNFFYSND